MFNQGESGFLQLDVDDWFICWIKLVKMETVSFRDT